MAISLRRAFSIRNVLLIRSSALHSRDFSYLISSDYGVCNSEARRVLTLPAIDFIRESRRGFAKGRKSKDDSAASSVEVLPDMGPTIKSNATSQMEAAIAALSGELTKLRTGRASAGMLDHIIVDTGDVKLPLNQIAVVSVLDSKTLLTKEHIQAVCKVVMKSCEDARQSIRRARQKAMDTIKKLQSSYPKDDLKRLEKEVEELTKKFIKTAEDLSKAKEKEITS
ncbi:hypothetical protein F8388_010336 [Cannabis sativa]|uniref:Ribosome-recycling factor, chloroplastic n=1 Tax=Cannabis sativa TaxID=3483 RepID=A0A7J6HR15_CANSA|nr:hypothetical protein F8388_010336 [Cannabis sativa]KAF4397445.1 hypothetical protein G4B88_027185 [Cannabis sativa]